MAFSQRIGLVHGWPRQENPQRCRQIAHCTYVGPSEGRTLIDRDTDYGSPLYGSKTWLSTGEPSLGAWIRF
jgi:hypothetical protein